MTTVIIGVHLEVANDSAGEVYIWIDARNTEPGESPLPWTSKNQVYWGEGCDGRVFPRFHIENGGSGYIPGAPIEGHTIKLLGGVDVDHDTLIR